ncbi:DUF4180 domain-containing protein [Tumebacillus permanentifrigoris]|uniref:Uncharacterized protein DUF4180 n=1 Tax=Tumebacillus permanentifrigoris TaxID=378543 RepID=A0A316D5Z6_9BACL|nr:DUF4180 domain-containing protein [Tumebacillus permanentifrigoris]PWK09603.1 uncharacterized protein DUF4180 [Tumebacillus permanentifrigoris]
MQVLIDQMGTSKVAIVESSDIVISDVQGALDLMASVRYTYGCEKILLNKSNLAEDFFELKTRLAGEILQKYTNYKVRLAVVGDFDEYDSKSLQDFIYESNKGKQVFFLKDKQAALHALHSIA